MKEHLEHLKVPPSNTYFGILYNAPQSTSHSWDSYELRATSCAGKALASSGQELLRQFPSELCFAWKSFTPQSSHFQTARPCFFFKQVEHFFQRFTKVWNDVCTFISCRFLCFFSPRRCSGCAKALRPRSASPLRFSSFTCHQNECVIYIIYIDTYYI